MKKALTTAGVALALGLFAGVATTAHAEDTVQGSPTDSNANFEVTAVEGAEGLTLEKVPSFDFGKISQSDIISGTADKLSLKSAPSTDPITIKDYRGTSVGWTLTAGLGAFHNGDNNTLNAKNMLLTKANTDVSGSDNYKSGITDGADLVTNGTVMATTAAADDTGTGQTTAVFKQDAATLNLQKDPTAKAGTYQATITWKLGTGAAAPVAGDTTAATSTTTEP